MARSLTVISLLFQSTTHCRYRVYTKFLLTYTAIYQRNRKVLPLGISALQHQSHFHLGTSYTCACSSYCRLLVIGYFGMKNLLLCSKYRLLGDDFILLLSCNKNIYHLTMISNLIDAISTICT